MKKSKLTFFFMLLTACQPTESPTALSPSSPAATTADDWWQTFNDSGQRRHYLLPHETDLGAIPQDPQNPLTPEKVALGKLLFHETALALQSKNAQNGTWSCATCHFAQAGFQDARVQSLADGGIGNGSERKLKHALVSPDKPDGPNVRSPSILNVAYQKNLLWNGMAGGMGDNLAVQSQWQKGKPHGFNYLKLEGAETQAIIALGVHRQSHDDHNFATVKTPLSVLAAYPAYQQRFDKAFPGEQVSRYTLGLAMAAYERTVLPTQAPFQRFLRGDTQALNAEQQAGAQLFFGKARCHACHNSPGLSGSQYYALGLKDMTIEFGLPPDENTQKGRGGFTGRAEDAYKFKVPQLYNLKRLVSLGHGGSFVSDDQQSALEKMMRYKLKGQAENLRVPSSQLARQFVAMAEVDFSEQEIQQLLAFVADGLEDPNLARYEPRDLPSRRQPINDESPFTRP